MLKRIRWIGWSIVVSLPLALVASEPPPQDDMAKAALSSPNFSSEQRLASMRAYQAQAHPMWRDLSPSARAARFLMFGNRLARAKIAAASGDETGTPAMASFRGNLTLIKGPAREVIALQRLGDCSLSLLHGSYTLSLTAPTISVQGTTADYQRQLRAAAGLGAAGTASGCSDPSLGIGSRRGVYLGRTAGNQWVFAASGYNYAAASNALYHGTIDAATQTVTSFEVDVSVPELGALAAGDLDGDGLNDVVGIDRFAGGVAVWRGRADGGLQAMTRYPVPGDRTNAVLIADVDGDGRLDVVAASQQTTTGQESVSVLRGRGDGTLESARTLDVSTPGGSFTPQIVNLVAVDLRGTGRADIVGSNGLVLLNNGSGIYTQAAFGFAARGASSSFGPNLAAGDFDGDGKADIATNDGTTVRIHLGRGDGSFAAGRSYASNDSVGYLTATDLDGDGHLDLYIGLANGGFFGGDQFNVGEAYALMGAGDGSFSGAPVMPFVYTGSNLADLDGDGRLDAVGVNADRSFSVYRGDGRGGFEAIATLPTTNLVIGGAAASVGDIESFALADIDGDGFKDLVFLARNFVARGPAGYYTAGLLIAPGRAGGTFGTPRFMAAPSFLAAGDIDIAPELSNLRLADINGDGKADLVYAYTVSSYDTNTFQVGNAVQLGNGDGSFQPPKRMLFRSVPTSAGTFYQRATVQRIADLNGDGRPDLVLITTTAVNDSSLGGFVAELQVALGLGDGSFAAPARVVGPDRLARYLGQPQPVPLAVADMNLDGKPDLVVLGGGASGGTQVAVLLGRGDGSFDAPILKTYPGQYLNNDQGLAVGDFNGDGKPDVVVTDPYIGSNSGISFGNGDGTLQGLGSGSSVTHNLRIGIPVGGATTVMDLNGDGRPDVWTGQTLLLSADAASVAEPPGFVVAPSSITGTASAGGSVQTVLALTPGAGFSGTVSFSCAGLPRGARCSFDPPTLNLGAAAGSTTVTISTTARSTAAAWYPGVPADPMWPAGAAIAFAGVLLLRRGAAGAGMRRVATAGMLLAGGIALNGCGGDGGGSSAAEMGTPAGSYPVQISASDGTVSRNLTYTLVVN